MCPIDAWYYLQNYNVTMAFYSHVDGDGLCEALLELARRLYRVATLTISQNGSRCFRNLDGDGETSRSPNGKTDLEERPSTNKSRSWFPLLHTGETIFAAHTFELSIEWRHLFL